MMTGRPPTYETVEELENKVIEYFEKKDSKPTISGLAFHLGFESRQSFYDYEKREGFSYTIKRARLRIEQVYEERMVDGGGAGSIFALKNLGWSDKSEQEVTHKGVTLNFVPAPGCEPIKDE